VGGQRVGVDKPVPRRRDGKKDLKTTSKKGRGEREIKYEPLLQGAKKKNTKSFGKKKVSRERPEKKKGKGWGKGKRKL